MTASSDTLRAETQRLAQALRAPHVRGQWGELQLQRVCELAGMLAYCDFTPQTTLRHSDVVQRPDLIVRLPGDRQLVVDAKTPLAAYLDAMAAPDDSTRATLLMAHAAQVRSQVQRLAAKQYWAQFPASPEFVILFLPGEAFFAAALEADPSLLEVALRERVLLATPITLIALLKAAATGWRQARVSADAAQVIALGQELHQRLMAFETQLGDIGTGLQRAVEAYNRSVGSLDRRVLVSARKLAALQDDTAVLEAPAPIDTLVRPVGRTDPVRSPSTAAPPAHAVDAL
jgi:DNA recombination protein RmuC